MGFDDKIENKVDELRGKAKAGIGRATGDESLEAQGHREEAEAKIKQTAEKVKDVFRH